MADENPTVEEPKTEIPDKIETDQVDALLKELETAGVTKPEQLQGKFRALERYNETTQTLGQVRKENAEMKQMIQQMQSQPKPAQPEMDDFMDTSQTIDIEGVVGRSVEQALSRREQAQRVAQETAMKTWQSIQGDENYELVKPIWEEKLKDPGFVYELQSGARDPYKEYTNTVMGYFKGMAKRAGETIRTLRGETVPPPHMESADKAPPPPQDTTVEEEKTQDLKKKVDQGYIPSDEEMIDLLGQL